VSQAILGSLQYRTTQGRRDIIGPSNRLNLIEKAQPSWAAMPCLRSSRVECCAAAGTKLYDAMSSTQISNQLLAFSGEQLQASPY
jgi:hypothetical protein